MCDLLHACPLQDKKKSLGWDGWGWGELHFSHLWIHRVYLQYLALSKCSINWKEGRKGGKREGGKEGQERRGEHRRGKADRPEGTGWGGGPGRAFRTCPVLPANIHSVPSLCTPHSPRCHLGLQHKPGLPLPCPKAWGWHFPGKVGRTPVSEPCQWLREQSAGIGR